MDSKNRAKEQSKPRAKQPNKPRSQFEPLPLSPDAGHLIAVTGGIGTGKTFVLECFAKLGFAVFNADKVVHQLLERSGEAFPMVAKLFPQAVEEHGINRQIMGELVFADPSLLQQLEAILHPLVRQKQVEFMLQVKQQGNKSAVFEVPLLFENKREDQFKHIIVTSASPEIQKERVLQRPGMTEEKFMAIVKKQVPNSLRLKKAHHVIHTNKTPQDTLEQVRRIVLGHSPFKKRHPDRAKNPKAKKFRKAD